MMEIKIGKKYLWAEYNESVEVEILAGPDLCGSYCAETNGGYFVVVNAMDLYLPRTPEDIERDELNKKIGNLPLGVTVEDYILENYVRKDDPRVVEPISHEEYIDFVNSTLDYDNDFKWLKENKHICVKGD